MNFWIFQAVPERYDLVEKMKSLQSEQWFVTRYYDEIKAGDIVHFWLAGKAAGLYGWGQILSPAPYLIPDGDYRVQVSYQVRFMMSPDRSDKAQAPIPKEMVRQDSELSQLQILLAPQGTNFRVKPTEADALNRLIKSAGFTEPQPGAQGREGSL
jgi:hypothetical protein